MNVNTFMMTVKKGTEFGMYVLVTSVVYCVQAKERGRSNEEVL